MARLRCTALNRAGASVLLALLSLVYAANVPFYCGSTIGTSYAWRIEHGRLTIRHAPNVGRESFYVAVNSEGLTFTWDAHWYSRSDWFVRVPLWAPWLLAALWCALAWRPRRAGAAVCACGYARDGLPPGAPCPECGVIPPAPSTTPPRTPAPPARP